VPEASLPRLGEDVLAQHLDRAKRIPMSRVPVAVEGPSGLPDDFEALRWFPCLER